MAIAPTVLAVTSIPLGGRSRATQLVLLETEERWLKSRMERDRIRRTTIREEVTRLRCSLTYADRVEYDSLQAIEGARGGARRE